MTEGELPEWLLAPRSDRESRERPRRSVERADLAGWALALALGLAWGIMFKRTWPLIEVQSVFPILALVLGPGVVAVVVLVRVLTGSFERRTTGARIALAVAGALASSSVVPGLAPSVVVGGSLSATLGGGATETTAECRWGPGRDRIIAVTGAVAVPSMFAGSGRLTVDLVGRTVFVLPPGLLNVMPLTVGPQAIAQAAAAGTRSADDRTGSILLSLDTRSVVGGQITWSCDAAPAGS